MRFLIIVAATGFAAPASAADLVCYAYDAEGRLKTATREDGSQFEYSFVASGSGHVDLNDNRQRLFQRTGRQSEANCPAPTGIGGFSGNGQVLALAPPDTFYVEQHVLDGPAPNDGESSTLIARNDTLSVEGSFQTIRLDVLANDAVGADPVWISRVSAPEAGGGFVQLSPEGLAYTSPASPGVYSFAYQITDRSGAQSDAVVEVTVTVPDSPAGVAADVEVLQ